MGRLHVMQSGVEATGRWSFLTREYQCSFGWRIYLVEKRKKPTLFLFKSFFLLIIGYAGSFAAFRLSAADSRLSSLQCYRLLTAVVSPVAGHKTLGAWPSAVVASLELDVWWHALESSWTGD